MSTQKNDKFADEALILLFINKNNHYYPLVHSKLFSDKFLQKFYSLCSRFYKKYKTSIFDNDNKSEAQIRHFVSKNKEIVTYDHKLSHEENVELFMSNVRLVFSYNISLYTDESLEEQFKIWFRIRSSFVNIVDGINYFKTSESLLKEADYGEIEKEIDKVRRIMMGGFDASIDDDIGLSILDREIHIQPDSTDLRPVGWKVIDRWSSGKDEGSGGFEPGTLTYLLGPPNVGKSIFLWSMAYGLMYNGGNILGASLEMSSNKIAKRIGANMFNVDIGSYQKFATDEAAFNEHIRRFKEHVSEDNIGQFTLGDLRIRRFSKATTNDLRIYVDRTEQKTGKKVHSLVLDYATELTSRSGITMDKMYQYHKENCDGLYELGVEMNMSVITAHQLHVKYKGMDDVNLSMVAESSAITQRPDLIYGMIQSDDMRRNRKYQLKLLKGRDTGGVGDKTTFDIDYQHMRLRPYDDIVDGNVI